MDNKCRYRLYPKLEGRNYDNENFKAGNRLPASKIWRTGEFKETGILRIKGQEMDKYAGFIMRELNRLDIACVYENREQLVYAYFGNRYGEVYCIYEYENRKVTSSSVCSLGIPACKADRVLEYLIFANRTINGGNFYIDRITGCVAFGAGYDISAAGPDTLAFASFCTLGYDVFTEHLESLYEILSL